MSREQGYRSLLSVGAMVLVAGTVLLLLLGLLRGLLADPGLLVVADLYQPEPRAEDVEACRSVDCTVKIQRLGEAHAVATGGRWALPPAGQLLPPPGEVFYFDDGDYYYLDGLMASPRSRDAARDEGEATRLGKFYHSPLLTMETLPQFDEFRSDARRRVAVAHAGLLVGVAPYKRERLGQDPADAAWTAARMDAMDKAMDDAYGDPFTELLFQPVPRLTEIQVPAWTLPLLVPGQAVALRLPVPVDTLRTARNSFIDSLSAAEASAIRATVRSPRRVDGELAWVQVEIADAAMPAAVALLQQYLRLADEPSLPLSLPVALEFSNPLSQERLHFSLPDEVVVVTGRDEGIVWVPLHGFAVPVYVRLVARQVPAGQFVPQWIVREIPGPGGLAIRRADWMRFSHAQRVALYQRRGKPLLAAGNGVVVRPADTLRPGLPLSL